MKLFAVILTRGPAWNDFAPLEGQEAWTEHAGFMDALTAERAVLLGGPLEGTPDVLLVMRAGSPDEIAALLRDDPWRGLDLLRLDRIMPWTLRLGRLPDDQKTSD